MQTINARYPKKIFLFEIKDYQRTLNYINEMALDKEEEEGIIFYFLDKVKKKIIRANIFKKTFEFTKNFDETFFNNLEKMIMRNGST